MDVDLVLLKLTNILFNGSCIAAGQKKKRKAAKRSLPVWNIKIQNAVCESKRAHWLWKKAGRPKDPNNVHLQKKKTARRQMRVTIRAEIGLRRETMHNLIMDTHESDSKVFFNIIKRQRSTRTSQTTRRGHLPYVAVLSFANRDQNKRI